MTGHRKWSDIRSAAMDDPLQRHRREELRRANDLALELGRVRDQREALIAEGLSGGDGAMAARELAIHDTDFLSALRESIEDLGGRLELVAVFPDQRIVLAPEFCTSDEMASE